MSDNNIASEFFIECDNEGKLRVAYMNGSTKVYAMDSAISDQSVVENICFRLNLDTKAHSLYDLPIEKGRDVSIYIHDFKCHGAWYV
jgi:hypothetical protein